MGGYGEDYAKIRGIYNAAPAELFVQGQEDALAAYVDEQKAILYPPKKPPVIKSPSVEVEIRPPSVKTPIPKKTSKKKLHLKT